MGRRHNRRSRARDLRNPRARALRTGCPRREDQFASRAQDTNASRPKEEIPSGKKGSEVNSPTSLPLVSAALGPRGAKDLFGSAASPLGAAQHGGDSERAARA